MARSRAASKCARVLLPVGLVLLTGTLPAHALVNPVTFNFSGGTAGNYDWYDGSNWTYTDSTVPTPLTGTGVIPGQIGQYYPAGDKVIIGETTGDRTITTPTVTSNVFEFTMTQTPTSSGVNTLKLGGNLYQYGYPWTFTVNNTTGDASKMVIDLNGYTLGAYIGSYDYVTFKNSVPGGSIVDSYGPGIYHSIIESGVTIKATGWMWSGGNTNNWMPGSRLVLTNSVTMYTYGDQQAYQMDIGESGNPTQGAMVLVNNWAQSVKSDVVIYAPTSGNPLSLGNSTFSVGGNFTDYGADSADSYTDGTIIFNGSPATARNISIDRHLNSTVDIRVGNSSADKGNIKLAQNLDMAGDFYVTNGSAIDLGDPMLTVGSFTQLADPLAAATSIDIGIDLTGVPGTVQVNGDLTLNDFTLHIYGHTDLTQDLVIFTYTGSLIGTPNLVGIDVDTSTGRLYYDALVASGGQVKLTNLFIPEPASLALLAAGGLLMLRRHRSER